MKELNKIEIPSTKEQDFNSANSVWKNGKLMIQRGAIRDVYFIGHETRTVTEVPEGSEEAEPVTRQATFAFPIEVKKPATYGDVVNAAERQAYAIFTDEAAISFTASLGRKYRENNEDAEVVEHDQFIDYVKTELATIFK
ncbi:MAG: hypothetical protein NC131_06245 [Roseburia sp.]|nr:hypothetical protein [Roseburia sp.]